MKTRRWFRSTLMLGAFSFLNGQYLPAQNKEPFHWDIQCEQRGCMMFLDVLHGAAGEKTPPDPKDSNQYISLMVAVDRQTRKPAYLVFHFPPDAEEKQGFFVAFAHTIRVNGQLTMKPDAKGMNNLGFDSCGKESCVARLREGKVDDGKGGLIDLLGQFNDADNLWLMYSRGGQPIRTMIPLEPFKTAYQQIVTKELAPQR